jgi:hypothetical protein
LPETRDSSKIPPIFLSLFLVDFMSVADWFSTFHSNLAITNEGDISYRYKRITQRLNTDFRETSSETANSIYVGSYGRDAEMSPSGPSQTVRPALQVVRVGG